MVADCSRSQVLCSDGDMIVCIPLFCSNAVVSVTYCTSRACHTTPAGYALLLCTPAVPTAESAAAMTQHKPILDPNMPVASAAPAAESVTADFCLLYQLRSRDPEPQVLSRAAVTD